jgi:hypothetical protein
LGKSQSLLCSYKIQVTIATRLQGRKSTRFEGTGITDPVRHGKVRVVEDVLHRLLHVVDLGAVPWEEVPPVVDVALGLGGGTVVAMNLAEIQDWFGLLELAELFQGL